MIFSVPVTDIPDFHRMLEVWLSCDLDENNNMTPVTNVHSLSYIMYVMEIKKDSYLK